MVTAYFIPRRPSDAQTNRGRSGKPQPRSMNLPERWTLGLSTELTALFSPEVRQGRSDQGSPLREQPVNSIGGLQRDYIRSIVRIAIHP